MAAWLNYYPPNYQEWLFGALGFAPGDELRPELLESLFGLSRDFRGESAPAPDYFADSATLKGGDADENAAILRSLFAGNASKEVTDIVALNAAAAIYVNAQDDLPFADAVASAREAIANGSASATLAALVAFSQSAA